MIIFFRKIRRQLIDEGSLKNYLVYAFGKIILVMIGILLAIQVNNWDQTRIIRQQEKVLLADIHAEFKYIKSALESNLLRYDKSSKSLSRIIDLFPIDNRTINLDTLAFL